MSTMSRGVNKSQTISEFWNPSHPQSEKHHINWRASVLIMCRNW